MTQVMNMERGGETLLACMHSVINWIMIYRIQRGPNPPNIPWSWSFAWVCGVNGFTCNLCDMAVMQGAKKSGHTKRRSGEAWLVALTYWQRTKTGQREWGWLSSNHNGIINGSRQCCSCSFFIRMWKTGPDWPNTHLVKTLAMLDDEYEHEVERSGDQRSEWQKCQSEENCGEDNLLKTF